MGSVLRYCDIYVRRSPRQRGLIGDVRAAAVYFAPSRCEIPFEILPPPGFPETSRPEAAAPTNLSDAILPHPQPSVQTAQSRATP
jgi:hypothetical protein